MPDFVTVTERDGSVRKIPVVQVWVDPKRPNAHRDPALRAYLWGRAQAGETALIRYSATEAFVLAAPATPGGEWLEIQGNGEPVQHSTAEIVEALGGLTVHTDGKTNAQG